MELNDLGPDPEGATPLELDELEGLKLSYISSRAQLDAAEFKNISEADNWFRRSNIKSEQILTTEFLIRLHKKMFGDIWGWAGHWRKRMTNIGVDWKQVPTKTTDAMGDATYWHLNEQYPAAEFAIRLHHRLVQIHPFPNGNGRVTRAIADYYLISLGDEPLTWGSKTLASKSEARTAYIRALKEADQTGNFELLIDFASS